MKIDEEQMDLLVKNRRDNCMHIHNILPSEEGGPPCKRCLASWRLNLIVNKKKKETKRLQQSKKILLNNHPKCSSCGILFGDLHLDAPRSIQETGEQLCSVCWRTRYMKDKEE